MITGYTVLLLGTNDDVYREYPALSNGTAALNASFTNQSNTIQNPILPSFLILFQFWILPYCPKRITFEWLVETKFTFEESNKIEAKARRIKENDCNFAWFWFGSSWIWDGYNLRDKAIELNIIQFEDAKYKKLFTIWYKYNN